MRGVEEGFVIECLLENQLEKHLMFDHLMFLILEGLPGKFFFLPDRKCFCAVPIERNRALSEEPCEFTSCVLSLWKVGGDFPTRETREATNLGWR